MRPGSEDRDEQPGGDLDVARIFAATTCLGTSLHLSNYPDKCNDVTHGRVQSAGQLTSTGTVPTGSEGALGLTDQDPILALGVMPVGVVDWFGDQPHAVWPWAQDELGDAEPVIVGVDTELNYEQIASLRPDLIIGVYSGITEDQYDTLSQIAPTVAQPDGYVDYGVPWQEQTRIIARALGRAEKAEELIAEVEERFVEAREAHPEFPGKTALVATPAGGGIYGVYGPNEVSGRFLTSLGFALPTEIVELVGDGVQADISREQFELLDADVLIWLLNSPDERETLANDPVYQQLGVASEGREVFLEYEPFGGAIFFSSVLSLPFLLDGLVPQLAAAADGDPATMGS